MLRENNNGRSNREYKRAVIDYFIPPILFGPPYARMRQGQGSSNEFIEESPVHVET